MEQAELTQLSGVIRSAMGDSAGKFKQAAESGNANLAKIMGTVAAAIRAQRQDFAELQNVLQENESVAERNSSTLQAIQSELQDINSGIHDMATGIKNMARGISNVDGSIFRLNQDLQSSIGQSLLPGILTGLSGTASSIVKGITALAVGGLALGGAKTAMDYMTGGGAGGEGGGFGGTKPMDHTGNSSEAMGFFQSKGWTKEQAAGIVGNLQVESGNFSSDVISGKKRGDGGVAVGIAQWHPDRQANFQAVFGKPLAGSSFKEQLEFVDWELKHTESKAGKILSTKTDAASAAAAVDEYYERSSGEHRSKRMANAASLAGSSRSTEPSTTKGATTTPQSSPMQSQPEQPPVSSDTVPRVERIGGEHGHGPISGTAEHGEKMNADSAKQFLQSRQGGGHGFVGVNADKLDPQFATKMAEAIKKAEAATGTKAVITEGYRPPEVQAQYYANYVQRPIPWEGKMYYPQKQGGIAAPPGRSRHQRGLAVDLADNAARDWLVAHAGQLGLGRVPGDAPHFQSGGGLSEEAAAKTSYPTTGQQVTPSAGPTATTPVTPGVSAGITPEQMSMLSGGMNPMAMAATSAMMSQLQSAQEEAASIAPQQQAEQPQLQQLSSAEILSQLSKSAENTQIVQQTAVQKQAEQEISQQEPIVDLLSSIFGQMNGGSSTVVNNSSNVSGGGYNGIYDVGWPDWAEMIGGNHWKEMKNYKKNMWT